AQILAARSRLFELALVLERLDHVAAFIGNADHGIKFFGDTEWLARSTWVEDNCFFPVGHDNQLRPHHSHAESDWQYVPEYCCQHQQPDYPYYLSFPNRCHQHRWHEDGRRQNLYYALAHGKSAESECRPSTEQTCAANG